MALPKAALIQRIGSSEKANNIAKAKRYVAEAASNGAQIVCLQELFNTTYFCYTEDSLLGSGRANRWPDCSGNAKLPPKTG